MKYVIIAKEKGFTLIELMTVVSLIGILSAIAIPNFLKFRTITKASEAKYNLGAIRSCEETYRAEKDMYFECAPCPVDVPNGRLPKEEFTGGGKADFDTLGFHPVGGVWYRYSVTSTDGGLTNFLCRAEGDLDADGIVGEFNVNNVSKQIVHVDEDIY
ncbi:MAG: type IV pilin protein [bacterium]